MHITTDRALIPAGAPAVRYLHVLITAPSKPADPTKRVPASVSIVLDRSGSMGGTKFEMARQAAVHAVKLLSATDHFAVVCYDEEVTTVVDRTHATREAKQLALQRLETIDARGSTDLHGGWHRGAELTTAREGDAAGTVSKVMLLTDGLANHGVIDHELLLAAAKQLRGQGIATSTFGVGADFDEELLSRLAVEGGGHFYFIERPQQIPDFFASELGETLEVVAREVSFELTCDPGVEVMTLNDLPFDLEPARLRVNLGDLVADQEVSLVIAVAFKGTQQEGASLGVECRMVDRQGVLPSLPMTIKWESVDSARDKGQVVNRDVHVEVAKVIAGRARRMALAANAVGKFDEAKRVIQDALSDLRALAQGDRRVLKIIDELHHEELELVEALSPMARKARHFAAYQVAHSREAGGTAKRSKKPR